MMCLMEETKDETREAIYLHVDVKVCLAPRHLFDVCV
jgi:hypothetical protein